MLATALLSAALFAPGPGWHVGAGRVRGAQVGSYAATVRWRDCAACLPHRTLARLPADGVALQILLARDPDPPKWMRPLRWPPRLAPVVSPFEGLPARIGVFQTLGVVRGYSVYLFAFFGRPTPTASQLRRARAELATVVFPRHP